VCTWLASTSLNIQKIKSHAELKVLPFGACVYLVATFLLFEGILTANAAGCRHPVVRTPETITSRAFSFSGASKRWVRSYFHYSTFQKIYVFYNVLKFSAFFC
jgi:hypothetical protein